jgi:hypothetical protein
LGVLIKREFLIMEYIIEYTETPRIDFEPISWEGKYLVRGMELRSLVEGSSTEGETPSPDMLGKAKIT